MRPATKTNLERQEAEIERFKKQNSKAVRELPIGYLSINYKQYSSSAQKIMQALDFGGKAMRKQLDLTPIAWRSAIKEVKKKSKLKLKMITRKGVVIGIKRENP